MSKQILSKMLGHLYIHLHTTCDTQIRGVSMEISMAFHQETKKQ